jgi:hypothetical protein
VNVPGGVSRDVAARGDDDVSEDVEEGGEGERLCATENVGKFGSERFRDGEHDRLCGRDRSEQTVLREG